MLLVRPRPVLGESRHGFLLRTASVNALASPGWITSDWANSLMATPFSASELRGPMTGHRHLAHSDIRGLPSRYWNTLRPRCCQLCLAEAPVWRSLWELVFYTDCHLHKVELVDACSSCQRPLRWKRDDLLRCTCGAELVSASGIDSSPLALQKSSELARVWMEGAVSVVGDPDAMTVEEVLYRTWLIGAYGSQAARKAQKLGNLYDVAFAREIAKAAVLPTGDWPLSLFAWLDQVADHYGSVRSLRITRRFGRLYKALFDPKWERALRDVRAGFEQYVEKRWPGQLAARNRRLSMAVRDCHAWVPLTRAAEDLHWKMPRLRSAIERGIVRGHLTRHDSGRTSGTIHRDDLARLRVEVSDEMTLLDVCAFLRMGKKTVKTLVSNGALRPTSGPLIDGCTIWRFRRRDVEAFALRASTV